MQRFLLSILIETLAVLFCAYLLPGVHAEGFITALLVALALSLLNEFVRPLLIILTIPATIFTFGLFLLVINALIILLADWLVVDFEVDGFWWAVLFSLILTLVKSLLNSIIGKKERRSERED